MKTIHNLVVKKMPAGAVGKDDVAPKWVPKKEISEDGRWKTLCWDTDSWHVLKGLKKAQLPAQPPKPGFVVSLPALPSSSFSLISFWSYRCNYDGKGKLAKSCLHIYTGSDEENQDSEQC
jgi:hypothetical protein